MKKTPIHLFLKRSLLTPKPTFYLKKVKRFSTWLLSFLLPERKNAFHKKRSAFISRLFSMMKIPSEGTRNNIRSTRNKSSTDITMKRRYFTEWLPVMKNGFSMTIRNFRTDPLKKINRSMVCNGCFKKTQQVRIRGDSLKNQTDERIEELVIPLGITGFLEVQKDLMSKVAFIHFQSPESAAMFFYQYENTDISIGQNVVRVLPVVDEVYIPIRYNLPTTPTTPEVNSAEVAPTTTPTTPTTPTTEPVWRTSIKRAISEIDHEIEVLKKRRSYLELSLE